MTYLTNKKYDLTIPERVLLDLIQNSNGKLNMYQASIKLKCSPNTIADMIFELMRRNYLRQSNENYNLTKLGADESMPFEKFSLDSDFIEEPSFRCSWDAPIYLPSDALALD